jgi:signal transduction histidine kinase
VASAVTMASLISEAQDATRRISDLVSAVKSYSQLDRATVQEVKVTDGLESTLIMLGHKLREGVTVRREYADDLPLVVASPGELNQVWTNLVDNAVDAMAGGGTLTVRTYADEHAVVVEIADTGPGMTADVAAHAFEPFFTTKEVGRGTGLGLDISRRIVVERHGGEITVDPAPGDTVVRVRLPLRPSG